MDLPGLTRPFVHRYPRGQAVHVGRGQARELAERLAELDAHRGLVVTGSNIDRRLVAEVVDAAEGRVCGWFDGVKGHVPSSTVEAGAELAATERADALVSIGGGSAHDTARAIAVRLSAGRRFDELFEGRRSLRWTPGLGGPMLPLVGLPTTLSAAETTFGAGVTHEGVKLIVVGEDLFFTTLVLDVDLFATTPLTVLLATGQNALNHSVERLLSPGVQPLAEAAFRRSIPLLTNGLMDLAADGRVTLGRPLIDAVLGAHLSTSTNVLGGLGHAVAHVIGARYGASHGVINGIVMPAVVRLHGESSSAAVGTIGQALGWDLSEAPAADAVAERLRSIVAALGMPGTLQAVGVPRDALEGIAQDVLRDFSIEVARPGTDLATVMSLLRDSW